MVAVLRQEVIRGALEHFRGFFDNSFYPLLGFNGEAVKDFASECTSGGDRLWRSVVYARHASSVVTSICVLFISYRHSRVQERRADGPEGGRETAGLDGSKVSRYYG